MGSRGSDSSWYGNWNYDLRNNSSRNQMRMEKKMREKRKARSAHN